MEVYIGHGYALYPEGFSQKPEAGCVQMEKAEESDKALILVNPKLADIPSHSGVMGVRCAQLQRRVEPSLRPQQIPACGNGMSSRTEALPEPRVQCLSTGGALKSG